MVHSTFDFSCAGNDDRTFVSTEGGVNNFSTADIDRTFESLQGTCNSCTCDSDIGTADKCVNSTVDNSIAGCKNLTCNSCGIDSCIAADSCVDSDIVCVVESHIAADSCSCIDIISGISCVNSQIAGSKESTLNSIFLCFESDVFTGNNSSFGFPVADFDIRS